MYLDGEDITEYNDLRMRSVRKKVQMVFQDPYASLNPRMSVFDIIAEPLLVHHLYQDKADLEKKVLDLLHRVGLDDYHANRYPHEFSGGQDVYKRQYSVSCIFLWCQCTIKSTY